MSCSGKECNFATNVVVVNSDSKEAVEKRDFSAIFQLIFLFFRFPEIADGKV